MFNLNNFIKVQESCGLYYVEVYVVFLVTLDGREIVYKYYFSRDLALKVVAFMRSEFADNFLRIYCESKLVCLK